VAKDLDQGGLAGVRVTQEKEPFFLQYKSTPVKYYAVSLGQESGKKDLIGGKAKKTSEVSFLEGLYIIFPFVNMTLSVVCIEYS